MADYIFDTETPNGQDFDGSWHTVGVLASVSVNAVAVGGRAYYPSSLPANFLWRLYRVSDQAVIAEVDLHALGGTNNAWNSFTSAQFANPGNVPLSSSEQYIPVIATNGDYKFGTPFTYPINHGGIITASEGRLSSTTTSAAFPNTTITNFVYFADVLVALAGPVVGGRSSTVATASSSPGKRAAVAGRATAVAVAWKSPLDNRHITATCYALARTTHRRQIRRPNTGVITRPVTAGITRPDTGSIARP